MSFIPLQGAEKSRLTGRKWGDTTAAEEVCTGHTVLIAPNSAVGSGTEDGSLSRWLAFATRMSPRLRRNTFTALVPGSGSVQRVPSI